MVTVTELHDCVSFDDDLKGQRRHGTGRDRWDRCRAGSSGAGLRRPRHAHLAPRQSVRAVPGFQLVAMMFLATITDLNRDRRPLLALTLVPTCLRVGGWLSRVGPRDFSGRAVRFGSQRRVSPSAHPDHRLRRIPAGRGLTERPTFVDFLAGALALCPRSSTRPDRWSYRWVCRAAGTRTGHAMRQPDFRPDRRLEDGAPRTSDL
jgi:hypothetical protein